MRRSQVCSSPRDKMPGKRRNKKRSQEDIVAIDQDKEDQDIKEPDTKRIQITQEDTATGSETPKSSKRQLHFVEEEQSTAGRQYWVLKSEPNVRLVNGKDVSYSLSELMSEPGQVTYWDGVRNSEANGCLKSMNKGDLAFFYHSNCREPGIVGLVQIVRPAYPDHTQFDPDSPHFDLRSSQAAPIWYMVDIKFVRKLQRPILLSELKKYQKEHCDSDGPLKDIKLVLRTRLSVQPLLKKEFDFIIDTIEPSTPPIITNKK